MSIHPDISTTSPRKNITKMLVSLSLHFILCLACCAPSIKLFHFMSLIDDKRLPPRKKSSFERCSFEVILFRLKFTIQSSMVEFPYSVEKTRQVYNLLQESMEQPLLGFRIAEEKPYRINSERFFSGTF